MWAIICWSFSWLHRGSPDVDRVLLRKRHLAVIAIDRAARGINQLFQALVAAPLEHVSEAIEVALDLSRGVLNRVTHSRLGGQVNHGPGLAVREQRGDRGSILEIELHETLLTISGLNSG